jgi:glycosyltransferase involved in cell wall biosynthesis
MVMLDKVRERAQQQKFLSQASALLFPIDWPEPFGLVMIEAMACGTPVLAFRCGSVPEIVEDGKTGFIVGSVDEAVQRCPSCLCSIETRSDPSSSSASHRLR